jgi:hypothetical protein
MSSLEHMISSEPDSLLHFTRATMQVLDDWQLGSDEIRVLLAMPDAVKSRAFNGFRRETPFPNNPEVQRRAHYVLRIYEALRTTFPTNPRMGGRWIRQGNRRCGNRSPLSVMLQGEEGLVCILAQVDCSYAWDISTAKQPDCLTH